MIDLVLVSLLVPVSPTRLKASEGRDLVRHSKHTSTHSHALLPHSQTGGSCCPCPASVKTNQAVVQALSREQGPSSGPSRCWRGDFAGSSLGPPNVLMETAGRTAWHCTTGPGGFPSSFWGPGASAGARGGPEEDRNRGCVACVCVCV